MQSEQEADAMLELMEIGNGILSQLPVLSLKIADIRIDVEPSAIPLLPVIRIDARLEIRLGF